MFFLFDQLFIHKKTALLIQEGGFVRAELYSTSASHPY